MRGRTPQSWPIFLGWSLTCLLVCLHPADAYSAVATWDGVPSVREGEPLATRLDGGASAPRLLTPIEPTVSSLASAWPQERSIFEQPAPVEKLEDVPPPPPSSMDGVRLSGYIGGVASLSADSSGYEPAVVLSLQAPLSTHKSGPTLDVTGELLALPGTSIDAGDVQTFRSLELGVGVWQPIKPSLIRVELYAQAGVASRRKGDTEPAVKSPLWAAFGLGLRAADHSRYITVALGPDERTSDYAQLALTVTAKATLPPLKTGMLKGGTAALVASVIRGLDLSQYGEGHPSRDGGVSSVRVALMVGF